MSTVLLNWYDENARSLPWRGEADVYRVWISEIMLQQTRSETVKRYYGRFLERFPSVDALARAPEDEVLKLWEGLGYYSRARNLHAAAKLVSAAGGRFPDTLEGLEALPGVGPYAARAVASIAYGLCAPALDGNQMRVYSRVLAVERVLKNPFDLEREAMELMSRERPGDYNQALMDLGASICTPRRPRCGDCPLAALCRARAAGEAERYPLRPAPVAKREEERTVFLIELPGGIAVRRRAQKGLLGRLYEFPSEPRRMGAEEAAAALRAAGWRGARELAELPEARHVFTHLVWRMRGFYLRAEAAPEGCFAADADALRALAFPSALRRYLEIAQALLDGGDCPPAARA